MQRYSYGAGRMIRLLFTADSHGLLEQQVERLCAAPVLRPFDPTAVAFVQAFAGRILQLPNLREFPELATLAHWFRPAALNRLAGRLQATADGLTRARGLVFHMAPANVDVLFAYAWLLSILCGNANVARLSQKPGAQRAAMLKVLADMHVTGEHDGVLQRQLLLTYPHDDPATTLFSRRCHARIVWGGDHTVARIRAVPLAPLAVERVFSDRFGVAVFAAASFMRATEDELVDLARRFCDDTLWFDQQACSSPRTVYWVGSAAEVAQARVRFWPCVRQAATRRPDHVAAMMARIADAHLMAAHGHRLQLASEWHHYPLCLSAPVADGALRELQSGHGLLVEVALSELHELASQLDDRDQTLVQHGFDSPGLRALLEAINNRAIDRVVPLGRALDFHHVWDGGDLFDVLTRRINCPSLHLAGG